MSPDPTDQGDKLGQPKAQPGPTEDAEPSPSTLEDALERNLRLTRDNAELKASEGLLRGVLSALPVHVAVLDARGRATAVNASWEHFLRPEAPGRDNGASARERGASRFDMLLRSHTELWRGVQNVLSGEKPSFCLEYAWQSGGDQYWLNAQAVPLPGEHGGGVLLTHQDVTEKKRMLVEITKSRDQAEDASKAKAEFLANMSHEIRTPLHGVLGMAELAMMTDLSPEQREYLRMIQSSARSLLGLINDILDFSKIEAGKMALDERPFSLRGLLAETLKVVSVAAQEKDILVKSEVEAGLPDMVLGDEGRIKQVLLNLLSNAVKFTDRGLVHVHAGRPPAGMEPLSGHAFRPGSAVLFRVSDTGAGIAGDKLSVIFDSFTQLDGSFTRRHEGTGLGLAISKRLILAMDGRIWAESTAGEGSTFFFLLCLPSQGDEAHGQPARPVPAQAGPSGPGSPCGPGGLHILLAEDNPVNQRFASVLLGKIGHRIIPVANGQAALDALNRSRFDLVLMDVQMPVMDGLEATRRIRAGLTKAPADIPVLALTAHAMKGDRERFLAAGMDAYVAKPLILDDLLEAIAQVVGRAGKGPKPGAGRAHAFGATAREAPRGPSGGGAERVFSADQDGSPIDRASAMEAARGNVDFLANLYQIWLADAPAKMDRIRQALEAGDLALVKKGAHAMKGAAGTLRAKPLYDAALALEKAALAEDAAACAATCETFVAEQKRLTDYLTAYLGDRKEQAGS